MAFGQSRRQFLAISAAAVALQACTSRPSGAIAGGFTHGVASGDPGPGTVRLWTRFSGGGAASHRLKVESSDDPDFGRATVVGETQASALNDFCASFVLADVPGDRWRYFRFAGPGGERSPIGRTRALPEARVDRFRVAVFSCANATSGWFNAYRHAAGRDDLDLALHLGDYIYESPVNRADAVPGIAALREIAPAQEIIALADYRQRYASYRLDADLLELHRRLPMICVWDDHETANNSWRDGASAHNPATEGDWASRKAAGVRAFREWLPMEAKDWGSYRIGDLATIFRLETRLVGRSRQLDEELDAILAAGGANLRANLESFKTGALADANRSMMGPDQESWLAEGLKASASSGQRWQVLAQQVILGSTLFPAAGAHWFAPGQAPTAEDTMMLQTRKIMSELGVPFSMDKWDGYPAARTRLYRAARAANANLVALTGDSHNAWAFDLADAGGSVGVEFAGQSVSSYGYERRFGGDPARIAADFIAANPGLRFMDSSRRGYFTLDITRDAIEAEYVFVPSGSARTAAVADTRRVSVAHGARKLEV